MASTPLFFNYLFAARGRLLLFVIVVFVFVIFIIVIWLVALGLVELFLVLLVRFLAVALTSAASSCFAGDGDGFVVVALGRYRSARGAAGATSHQ